MGIKKKKKKATHFNIGKSNYFNKKYIILLIINKL